MAVLMFSLALSPALSGLAFAVEEDPETQKEQRESDHEQEAQSDKDQSRDSDKDQSRDSDKDQKASDHESEKICTEKCAEEHIDEE